MLSWRIRARAMKPQANYAERRAKFEKKVHSTKNSKSNREQVSPISSFIPEKLVDDAPAVSALTPEAKYGEQA